MDFFHSETEIQSEHKKSRKIYHTSPHPKAKEEEETAGRKNFMKWQGCQW